MFLTKQILHIRTYFIILLSTVSSFSGITQCHATMGEMRSRAPEKRQFLARHYSGCGTGQMAPALI